MIADYKDDVLPNKEKSLFISSDEIDYIEDFYKKSFEDLFSNDSTKVFEAISNLTKIAAKNIELFNDYLAFAQILEIANNPNVENYIDILHFFNSVTSNSNHNMLPIFISEYFLSTLRNYLYFNSNNPDFFRILFRIYGDIIYASDYFSEKILSTQFLSRLFEIVHHEPLTSDYFIDLLGCILLRFNILMNFRIDTFPTIRKMIMFFFDSPNFVLISNIFSTLAQTSSITYYPFVKSFFVPPIIQKTAEVIVYDENFLPFTNVKKKAFYSMKKNALSIILNFSSLDDETRSILIETGLVDLNCTNICFQKSDNHIDKEMNKGLILVQNDLDSTLLPDIASNFFTGSHSNAIQFAYSLFWSSLITNYEHFNFETKQRIARTASLALKAQYDEDLITTILSHNIMPHIIEALVECFPTNSIGLELNCIEAIENMIHILNRHPKIVEINLAFEAMNNEGFIDEINDYLLNNEEIPRRMIPRIQSILNFFTNYFQARQNNNHLECIN